MWSELLWPEALREGDAQVSHSMSHEPPARLPARLRASARESIVAVLRLLTEPGQRVTEPVDRFQARLLSAVLLLAIPLAIWAGIIFPGDVGRTPQTVLITLAAVATIIPMYVLSRTAHYQLSAITIVLAASAIVVIAVIVNQTATTILYIACVSLGAVNFLRFRLAMVIIVGNILIMAFVVPIWVPAYDVHQFADELNVLVLLTVLAGFTTFLRHSYVLTIKRQSDHLLQEERKRSAYAIERRWAELLRDVMRSISHDVRTPLTSLKIQLHLMREDLQASSERTERLATIENEVRHLEAILGDIIEISSFDAGVTPEMKLVALGPLVNDVLRSLKHSYHHKQLHVAHDSQPAVMVRADPELLSRALAAVLDNAFKYTEERGAIGVRYAVQRGRVVLTVEDSGIGIASQHLPRLFDRFYKVNPSRNRVDGGLGIGLAITKKIIDLHNGHIEISSQAGVGTTVRIALPSSEGPLTGPA